MVVVGKEQEQALLLMLVECGLSKARLPRQGLALGR